MCECRTNGKEKKGDLPEGFFDDPKVDAKVDVLYDVQFSEIDLIGRIFICPCTCLFVM